MAKTVETYMRITRIYGAWQGPQTQLAFRRKGYSYFLVDSTGKKLMRGIGPARGIPLQAGKVRLNSYFLNHGSNKRYLGTVGMLLWPE